LTEWRRRLKPRRRRKMLTPPPAEFSTARRLKPARQSDFTAASRKRVGGAAEGSILNTWIHSFVNCWSFALFFTFYLKAFRIDFTAEYEWPANSPDYYVSGCNVASISQIYMYTYYIVIHRPFRSQNVHCIRYKLTCYWFLQSSEFMRFRWGRTIYASDINAIKIFKSFLVLVSETVIFSNLCVIGLVVCLFSNPQSLCVVVKALWNVGYN